MSLVFVYGTLKRGSRNYYLIQDAEFLGEHLTRENFDLYDFGGYPAATVNGSRQINGELFKVSSQQFDKLDELEGYPEFYQRIEIATALGKAWMYIVQSNRCIGMTRLTKDWVR